MAEDHLSHDNSLKNYLMWVMRLILILFLNLFISTNVFAEGNNRSSKDTSSCEAAMYDAVVQLINKA